MEYKMNFKFTSLRLFLIVSLLILSGIACRLGSFPDSISDSELINQNVLEPTLRNPDFQPVTLQLTESQVNLLVSQTLQANPGQEIQNATVRFVPGLMIIEGRVVQNNISLPLRLEVAVTPDGNGSLNYDLVSANVGPIPLPQNNRDDITSMMNQYLNPGVADLTGNIYIDTIEIGQGVVTITGHAR